MRSTGRVVGWVMVLVCAVGCGGGRSDAPAAGEPATEAGPADDPDALPVSTPTPLFDELHQQDEQWIVRNRATVYRQVRETLLEPDFEGAVGFRGRGPKPARAWKRLEGARREELPEPLVRAVQLALRSARPGLPSYS